jgi:hypothetical protein
MPRPVPRAPRAGRRTPWRDENTCTKHGVARPQTAVKDAAAICWAGARHRPLGVATLPQRTASRAVTARAGRLPRLNAAQMFTWMWPCRDSEVRFPFVSNVPVIGPEDANTAGSLKRAASAGARSIGSRPVARKLPELSAFTVSFAGPDVFTLTLFPFAGFVNVAPNSPMRSWPGWKLTGRTGRSGPSRRRSVAPSGVRGAGMAPARC